MENIVEDVEMFPKYSELHRNIKTTVQRKKEKKSTSIAPGWKGIQSVSQYQWIYRPETHNTYLNLYGVKVLKI